jgi:hypothetical protein
MRIPMLNRCLVIVSLCACALSVEALAQEKGLIHHWPLANNAKDIAGVSHGQAVDVDFDFAGPTGKSKTAARFDGRKSIIEVANGNSLKFGEEDFTLAVWVHTEQNLDDAIGDILSKFDAQERRGFNWCIKNGAGTVGSQSNFRNVQFGIDAGSEPKWTDCGRPGTNVFPMALATHDGKLFVGVCEPGKNDAGRVYQYGGGKDWIDCGSPDGSNAVTNLISHGGKLYAGTGNYRLRGSLLPESENTQPGGRVFCYEGDDKWTDCGRVGDVAALGGLVTYKGELYATPMYGPGALFRYAGDQQWLECPLPSPNRRIASPAVFNGDLYCVTFDGCDIYRFDGKSWSGPFMLESRGQTYGFDVHAGKLFASTWPNGKVYHSADGENWKDAGRSGEELEVMGLAVYNGKLYGGTLPLAEVYRFDGDDHWVNTGQLDLTPDVRYRRAWSMAVYDGKLFCGVLPSGRVHALAAGANVTDDHELKPGWRHLAATRSGDRLRLYVDGKLVAESRIPAQPAFNLANSQPLKIGFGGHDYFNGCLSDLRIYNRSLSTEEISTLAKKQIAP